MTKFAIREFSDMAKNLRITVLLISLLSTGCVFAHAQSSGNSGKTVRITAGSEITHKLISEETLYRQIAFLSDSVCNGRGTGSRGNNEAAFWIMRHFSALGILPFDGSYSKSFELGDGLVGRNIAGLLPSAGKAAGKRYMIVAAHYDGFGELDGKMYPGADSNASGVAAMLGAGKMLSAMMSYGKTYRQNVIFVAFDAKNINMNGAKEFWKLIEDGKLVDPVHGNIIRREDISVMVNIDQIGSTLSPLKSGNKEYLILLTDNNADFHRGSLKYANAKYNIGLELGFDYYGSPSFTEMFYRKVSEQKIFLDNNVPAVMFTSGITMNNNKTRDTVETLDMSVLKKRIWILFHWMERTM